MLVAIHFSDEERRESWAGVECGEQLLKITWEPSQGASLACCGRPAPCMSGVERGTWWHPQSWRRACRVVLVVLRLPWASSPSVIELVQDSMRTSVGLQS